MTTTSVRAVTYNVLSTGLTKGHDVDRSVAVLAEPLRWQLLHGQLTSYTSSSPRPVIFLQEVSHSWNGKLMSFFAERGYSWFFSGYADDWSHRMGVGIAVPTEQFEVLSMRVVRPGASIPPRPAGAPAPPSSHLWALLPFQKEINRFFASKWYNALCELFTATKALVIKPPPYQPTPSDNWHNAATRKNEMLIGVLREKDSQAAFVAATYHMPCAFRFPIIMLLHTLACMKILSAAAADAADVHAPLVPPSEAHDLASRRSLPIVFGGDFNLTPSSALYGLLATGSITAAEAECSDALATLSKGKDTHPFAELMASATACGGFESAMHVANGVEPPFTNASLTRIWGPTPQRFTDTLDYVFVRGARANGVAAKVVGASDPIPIPSIDELDEPKAVPSSVHPSDHFAVGVTVRFEGLAAAV